MKYNMYFHWITYSAFFILVFILQLSSKAVVAQLKIEHTDVTCEGASDGTAEVTGDNGTQSLSFMWSTGETSRKIIGLSEGNYSVTVCNAWCSITPGGTSGCTIVLYVTIDLSKTTIPISLSSAPESCDNTKDGTATISINGGTGPFNIEWSNGGTTTTISGLAAGTYHVEITDANGCHGSGSVVVEMSYEAFPVSINSSSDVTCHDGYDGSASASASGGVAPYTYQWSNGSGGSSVNNLSAGVYTVTVTDSVGCHGRTSVTIHEPDPLSIMINEGSTKVQFCDTVKNPSTTLTASASGGTPPYNLTWPGGSYTVTGTGEYCCSVTDANGCAASTCVYIVFIIVKCSEDPNVIAGPNGVGEKQWVSVNDNLAYSVYFSNDPDFATAPAQEVKIEIPLYSNVNLNSLRLGNFGFGNYNFVVPTNTPFYSKRIDLVDSLGIYLDVFAGLDVTKHEAFWIFTSIDPATGLPPNDPDKGFLPVNDSLTHKGEGFVTFTMKPKPTDLTGDSILAKADIVFDINDPISTNQWFNMVDAVAPTSNVNPLPAIINTTAFDITFSGHDDAGGCGINTYKLYFSKDTGPYTLFGEYNIGEVAHFIALPNSTYGFFSIAKDHVGNTEAKTSPDVTTTVWGNASLGNITVFLEGPFNSSPGVMETALNTDEYIPLVQPYGGSPWYYSGQEHVPSIPAGVVDWILVELRDAVSPQNATSDTKVAGWPKAMFLKSNGSVVDLNGNQLNFGIPTINHNLYVIIRHRNHIEVMSSAGMTLTGNVYSYDFSTSIDKAFGGGAGYKQIDISPPTYGMVAGDVDADGSVFISDFNLWASGFGNTDGYYQSDIDLDGSTFVSDFNKWAGNFGIINTGAGMQQVPKYSSSVPK